jgi:hypothetical protein
MSSQHQSWGVKLDLTDFKPLLFLMGLQQRQLNIMTTFFTATVQDH